MDKLKIRQIRYEFTCPQPLMLHHELPSITIRGAFGYALAQVIARQAGIPELEDQVALYKEFFMPQNDGTANSHDRELARPFVLRGSFTRPDRRSFIIEVLLFGIATEYEALFDEVFRTMAKMGLGLRNQVCDIEKIMSRILQLPDPEQYPFLLVTFLTPCARLKSQNVVFRDELPFHVLCARLIDRVEELNRLYGDGIPFHSFEEIGELKKAAQEVLYKKLSGEMYEVNRISGRTGDSMKLDGFLGTMEYHGDFTPFREYLRYLPFINLGRFNVFGCGWCRIEYSEKEVYY